MELKFIKKINPMETFKKLMSNQSIGFIEISPSSSTISGCEPSGNHVTQLIQQSKAKVFEVDLFKTIE